MHARFRSRSKHLRYVVNDDVTFRLLSSNTFAFVSQWPAASATTSIWTLERVSRATAGCIRTEKARSRACRVLTTSPVLAYRPPRNSLNAQVGNTFHRLHRTPFSSNISNIVFSPVCSGHVLFNRFEALQKMSAWNVPGALRSSGVRQLRR